MELLQEPRVWIAFATLALLEIVLGIDNIIFLSLLVDRLPPRQRRSGRLLGLGVAMLTRVALLFSITSLTRLTRPLADIAGRSVSIRDAILFVGGAFLCAKSLLEIRAMLRNRRKPGPAGKERGFAITIAQIAVIDVVFSLDSVFTAVGLSNRLEVMVAAIICAVLFMMWLSAVVSGFIHRHPTIKVLALVFLCAIGAELISQSLGFAIPQSYLYVAMAFAALVESVNIRLRARPLPDGRG
jgi:predicted tellurium resistance membrane protein TerC